MKKKVLSILLCGIIVLGLATGCGNNSKSDKQNSTDTNKNEVKENNNNSNSNKEKTVVCNYSDPTYPKMESVYLKGDKLVKIVNSHTTIVDSKRYLDIYCEQKNGDYNKLNNIKGTSAIINCDAEKMNVYDEETYIIDEIEDFDSITGLAIPSQLGSYFDEDSHKFYLDFWLEGKNTQGYTCEEK